MPVPPNPSSQSAATFQKGVRLSPAVPLDLIRLFAAAGVVGLVGGLAGEVFSLGNQAVLWLLTGHQTGLVETAQALPYARRALVPFVGALVAGLVLHVATPWLRRGGDADFMRAIHLGSGAIGWRPVLARTLASLWSIGSGGSIGREGGMVQLAAMTASRLASWARLPPRGHRLWVACGVAAGIASAYRAPIAGALFVAEIVVGSIAADTFGPIVFSAVVSTLVSRQFDPEGPLYPIVGGFTFRAWEVAPFLVLGTLCGVLGPLFLASLDWARAAFLKIRAPVYVHLSLGGLMVGGLSCVRPEVWGNGYTVIVRLLGDTYGLWTLLLIVLVKWAATCATIGSGAIGGVFTPTLMMGASFGLLFAQWVNEVTPLLPLDMRIYALVGMGSLLSATTHAPLMAIVMIYEMTLDYDTVLPMMIASILATTLAKRISARGVYTLEANASAPKQNHEQQGTVDLTPWTRPLVASLRDDSSYATVVAQFAATKQDILPVLGEEKKLVGIVFRRDLLAFLGRGQDAFFGRKESELTASALMRTGAVCAEKTLSAQAPKNAMVSAFVEAHHHALLVLAPDGRRVLGQVELEDLLEAGCAASETRTPGLLSHPAPRDALG